jgi:predicted Zn-dependent peptidase
VEDEVMLPRLFLAFRAPMFGTRDYYASSVTSAILGFRKASRLHRGLVRDRQVAADAKAFTFDLAKGSDLLVIDVTARPDTDVEALEQAVVEEVDELIAGGVSPEEVERAIALIQTEFVSAMQAASDRADRLSMFATYFGEPRLLNEQLDRYREVSAARVNTLARERLGPDNRAFLIYVPRQGAPGELALAGSEATVE